MGYLDGFKVGILVAHGFEQIEMEKPRLALNNKGATTFIISPEKDLVQGWNHMEKGNLFPVDVPLVQAKANDFDALLLPGGVINPDRLRTFPEAAELVRGMIEQKKTVAAICHGPWLLINAGVVKGCKVTSWSSIKIDLVNAGAEWVDEPVVYDHLLITSRKPDDIPQFNTAMIKVFESYQKRYK